MGVPSFYRWLVDRYPKVVTNAVEERGNFVDVTLPNPNGKEFDNLYLDMNGIIHSCFHPQDQFFPPSTYDEVFISMFEYIDRIFCIVRPRKLLYMAIDGVAPMAKLNQQRSRRFRAAKDAEIAEQEEERLRREFEKEGRRVLPKREYEVWDSNVITPGTVFMDKLSKSLEYYIRLRLNNDPGWKTVKVIMSDANVPGEGEHKIISFIRDQRTLPGYNPNTTHCLYGLDADLIMLALSTHEIHFSILREDVLNQQEDSILSFGTSLSKNEYEMVKSRGRFGKVFATNGRIPAYKPYQFLNIWTLREYLELDLMISDPPFQIDFERIVDDFIFLCVFTGNDFLPHLPSIEIQEGAMDLLIYVYKAQFKRIGGYLVDTSRVKDKKAAYINVKLVEKFILALGSFEDKIFEKRYNIWEPEYSTYQGGSHFGMHMKNVSSTRTPEIVAFSASGKHVYNAGSVISIDEQGSDIVNNTKMLMQKLKSLLRDRSDLFKHGVSQTDRVRLGLPGWRTRYYHEKFSAESPDDIENICREIVEGYTEGLCWVLQYYFAGLCSWTWFYPFHYGPFASDFKGLCCSSVAFNLGSPLKPFDQLMGVLPPKSGHALPKAYRHLMTSKESSIIQFYPSDFAVDTEGKRFIWQGITKLPFIKEELLVAETKKLESKLVGEEFERNATKMDKIFVMMPHDLGAEISSLYYRCKHISGNCKAQINIPIDSQACGIGGFLYLCDRISDKGHFSSPVKGMDDISDDHVLSANYKCPASNYHAPRPLVNVKMPKKTITIADIVERKLWHEDQGGRPQHNYK